MTDSALAPSNIVDDLVDAERQETVSDINVMVAGRGGDGSLTIVTLLSRLLGQRGFHMCSSRDVASRIKGGHAAAMLRGSLQPRWCMNDHLDIAVGFDEDTLKHAGPLLKDGSVVIYDSSLGEPDAAKVPEGVRLLAIPFGRMAVRDLRRELFKNSFSFGLLTRCLRVDDSEAIAILSAHVQRFPADIARANVEALEKGFGFADELGLHEGTGPLAACKIGPSKATPDVREPGRGIWFPGCRRSLLCRATR